MAHILIIDDSPTEVEMLTRWLQKGGFKVTSASSAEDGITAAKRDRPDLVIMDLSMPDMNGLQAAREITKTHPHLPLLLISVQEVSQQLVREACNAGYKGVVTKSRGRVIKGVAALLGQQTFFYVQDGSASDEQESRNCQPCLARH